MKYIRNAVPIIGAAFLRVIYFFFGFNNSLKSGCSALLSSHATKIVNTITII